MKPCNLCAHLAVLLVALGCRLHLQVPGQGDPPQLLPVAAGEGVVHLVPAGSQWLPPCNAASWQRAVQQGGKSRAGPLYLYLASSMSPLCSASSHVKGASSMAFLACKTAELLTQPSSPRCQTYSCRHHPFRPHSPLSWPALGCLRCRPPFPPQNTAAGPASPPDAAWCSCPVCGLQLMIP